MTNKEVKACSTEEEQKEFIDPVTTAAATSGIWFIAKAALSGIVGYLAVGWYKSLQKWWNKRKGVDEDNSGVSEEES